MHKVSVALDWKNSDVDEAHGRWRTCDACSVLNIEEFSFGGEVSHCGCGIPAKLYVSRTIRNSDQKFWGCAHQGGHYKFFNWHDEWVNDRTLLMLCELEKLNANLEAFESQSKEEAIAALNMEHKREIVKLKMKVKTMKELKSMKCSRNLYKIGFYALVGVIVCKMYVS
ncbi:conserved hypothetical protein [Ricinus communis]|uniref:Zinc finger GRF-type domain-containing protein n=1 Tax=Ricinus communis TaxID=3988 RepID=B9RMV0_RICCO|nr:conserved hypothetical protein [Ricinus communis]